jgi:predicted AAA+ superfamily ATPase
MNLSKRLVKSPKIYWRDAGLLHALLGIQSLDQLLAQPWAGASWEGFVIEQIHAALSRADLPPQAYFFRTHDQHEVDLVLDFGSRVWAVEVKMTSNPSVDMLKRLDASADLIKAEHRVLICRTAQSFTAGNRTICNLRWFLQHALRKLID